MSTTEGPRPRAGVNGARSRRYAAIDLAGITVRRAVSDDDFALVGRLREAGFSRVTDNTTTEWVDDFDRSPGVFSLIAYNSLNEPVATMRVQDGRVAELELARFVPLDSLLDSLGKPAIQGARLSVVKNARSMDAMIALFKAGWLWCRRENIKSIVMANPPWVKPLYDFLLFEDLGSSGHFQHAFLANTPHITMGMPVDRPASTWMAVQHPLCSQFNELVHPGLDFST